MSYSTLNRYLEPTNQYAYMKGGGPAGGTGMNTWWPVYGPGTRDFSAQDKSHPSETIFDKVVAPGKWSAHRVRVPPAEIVHAAQLRDPAPARRHMLRDTEHPDIDAKMKAHAVTQRQVFLRRAEMRQRRIDAWAGEPPIRLSAATMSEALRKSRSESDLMCSLDASKVSRDVYERNGYLVARTKEKPPRSKPLSFHSMMFAGDLTSSSTAPKRVGLKPPRRYDKGWKTLPESKFVFDPSTFLPVPRGGWDAQPSDKWPELGSTGRREFVPLPFDNDSSISSPKAEVN